MPDARYWIGSLVVARPFRSQRSCFMICKWYSVCPMKHCTDAGLLDPKWVNAYCKGDWSHCVRYQMEERGEPHPDWMLPDGTLDDGLREA